MFKNNFKIVHYYIYNHIFQYLFTFFINSCQFAIFVIRIWSFVLPYIICLRVSKYIWEGAFFSSPNLTGKMHIGYFKFQHSYAGSCIKWFYAFVRLALCHNTYLLCSPSNAWIVSCLLLFIGFMLRLIKKKKWPNYVLWATNPSITPLRVKCYNVPNNRAIDKVAYSALAW